MSDLLFVCSVIYQDRDLLSQRRKIRQDGLTDDFEVDFKRAVTAFDAVRQPLPQFDLDPFCGTYPDFSLDTKYPKGTPAP